MAVDSALSALTLKHGALHLALRPDLGGCIAGLWCGNVPVLRATPPEVLQSVRTSACYPLVPFSNRIAAAQMHWSDEVYSLEANFDPEPHAIHGVGWARSWEVVSTSETSTETSTGTTAASSATLRYRHSPDAAWPFAFEAEQTFQLDDQGLHLTLQVTNLAPHDAPVGLGWHPFFVKRPGSHVRFEAAGRWAMGDDKLPTHREASPGLHAACATLDIDHCFDGWQGTLYLEDDLLHVQLQSSLTHLVVFTNASKDFIAMEPVSHVNNALGTARAADALAALGVQRLPPLAHIEAHMHLRVNPA